MITYDKMNKKQRKVLNNKKRLTWGVLKPYTRSIPSGKIYNRKKNKKISEED